MIFWSSHHYRNIYFCLLIKHILSNIIISNQGYPNFSEIDNSLKHIFCWEIVLISFSVCHLKKKIVTMKYLKLRVYLGVKTCEGFLCFVAIVRVCRRDGPNWSKLATRASKTEDEAKFKVIPLKLFYYQTFFETWRNEHSWYEHYKNAIKIWGHRACLRVSRPWKRGIFTAFALKVWITFNQN